VVSVIGSTPGQLSPNQLSKRQQIIEAAQRVLAEQGLANCSVRAVADSSPLTKSAIHYYFSDMDELVDEAMSRHMEAFIARVRVAAGRETRPTERFWAAVKDYLDIFEENPGAALLWFDYWIDATRKGRTEPVDRMNSDVLAVFADLLTAVGVDEPAARAEALFSGLLGLVVQQSVRRRPFEAVRRQIQLYCDVPDATPDHP
jgi:AcrR family transcriptional regulator